MDVNVNFNEIPLLFQNYIDNNIQNEIPFNLINNLDPFYENKKLLDLHESINISNKENSKYDKSISNEEKDKCLLFFKSHNFTNEKEIIKKDENINKNKKFYENLTNSLEEDMKCCICLNKFTDPLLCPYCHHFFCRICINKWFLENKNNCVYCRKSLNIDSFIEISEFRKVLPILDLLKENNNKYFDYKIKKNIEKTIILCSNPIHVKKDDEKKNIDENKNNEEIDEIEADYYCFDCKKPFCSDCICINDDYSNCEHNNEHSVFNIEILNEMKFFDLLYEKENNNTIENLEKMNEELKNGINKLNKRKNNNLLFIEYIKNTYIKFADSKINKLNEMIKKNEEVIKKVKSKFNELDNFIKNLKNQENIKNSKNFKEIQDSIDLINYFDELPEETKKYLNECLKFNGKIHLKEYMNSKIEIDKINFYETTYKLDNNLFLIIINENFIQKNYSNNPFLYFNENEDSKNINKNNDNKNIRLKLVVKIEDNQNYCFDKQEENGKNKLFYPILFNNDNKYFEFNEMDEKEVCLIQHRELNSFESFRKKPKNSFKYLKKNIELDDFIVNNDKSNEDIKNSSIETINLRLDFITIN